MRIITSILLSFITLTSMAQTDYNQWSVGLSVGSHDGMFPTKTYTRVYQINYFGLNGRYMMNNRVGIMLDVGYDRLNFKNTDHKSNYWRTSVQGVVNAGDLLHFDNWTDRIGLLVHGGAGISHLWVNKDLRSENPEDPLFKGIDDMINYTFGATPQVKLNERVSLNADLSFRFHQRQTNYWDGLTTAPRRPIDGYFINLSIGASFYLGKHDRHADWTPTVYGGNPAETKDLEKRVAALEEALKDDDNDGVPNKYDSEPNTPAGTYVNSKGETIVEKEPVDLDKDKDGFLDTVDECPEIAGLVRGCPDRDKDGVPDYEDECPDEYGSVELNGCALSKEELDVVKSASESIYFNTGKAVIKSESFEGLDALAAILVKHPEVNAMIEGHTDNVGNDEKNLQLSKDRAAEVKKYLISKGVTSDRLDSEGFGSSKPVATNETDEGRAQNRRVKIITTTYTEEK